MANNIESSKISQSPAGSNSSQKSPNSNTTLSSSTAPWYKKKKIVFSLAGAVIVIVAVGLLLISRHNMSATQNAIEDGWHTLVLQSQTVVTTADKVKSTINDDDLNRDLNALNTTVHDQSYRADKLSTFLTGSTKKNQWKKFLKDYGVYIAKAAEKSETIADFNTDNYDELKSLAASAKQATLSTKSNIPNLSEDMPDGIFLLYNTFDTVKTNLDKQQADAKAAKDKATAQAAQDAVDKATVEKNVTLFEAAYVAADSSKMKAVMSSGFIGEYDFSQLTEVNRKYSYPDNFRIIDTKKDNGNYVVRVNTVYKSRDDAGSTTGQYTTGSTFTVIVNGSKWLIDSEKRDSAY